MKFGSTDTPNHCSSYFFTPPYFLPFAKQQGLLDEPGQGRKSLAIEAAKRYNCLRQLCKEIAELESRIL
jgi:hypothetical protein